MEALKEQILKALESCDWTPEGKFSVFGQYDKEFYLERKEGFEHKYRLLWAIANTLEPEKIVELGSHAGAGADAMMLGAPGAYYVGYDLFGVHDEPDYYWDPKSRLEEMMEHRGRVWDVNFHCHQVDLRRVSWVESGDLLVVDAQHDRLSALLDTKLALDASTKWILVDDYYGEGVRQGVENFLQMFGSRIKGQLFLDQINGYLLLDVS